MSETQSTLPGYEHYTDEQLAALETMRDPRYELKIARPEFANHILRRDGTNEADTDGAKMTALVTERIDALAAEKNYAIAAQLQAKMQEIEEALAQGRFLFILDEDKVPLVYFQCAVPGNPDLPKEMIA